MTTTTRAAVFQGRGRIAIREVPRPEPGVGQALEIEAAYELFAHQRDGVMKVSIRP